MVFSCCTRRVPGALTLTRRSDPHPLRWTWSWRGTEGRRPRVARNQGCIPTRAANVRSQSMRTAPAHRRPAPRPGRIAAHAQDERGRTVPEPSTTDPSDGCLHRRHERTSPARHARIDHRQVRILVSVLVALLLGAAVPRCGGRRGARRRVAAGPRAGRRTPLRAATLALRGRAPRRGPGGGSRPGGAGLPARDRRLRRVDRRQAGGHRGARRAADDLRAGRGLGRRRRRRRPPVRCWAGSTVTDSHCFPAACLHWGLIEGTGDGQVYLDPLSLVGGGPVRLLPLWREEPAPLGGGPGWTPPLERWRPAARLAGRRHHRSAASRYARGWACW